MSYKAEDFIFEEDFIISAECEDCGFITDEEDCDEHYHGCPECGGYLIYATSHEDCVCAICNRHMDMFEDAYRHNEDNDVFICVKCFRELEE